MTLAWRSTPRPVRHRIACHDDDAGAIVFVTVCSQISPRTVRERSARANSDVALQPRGHLAWSYAIAHFQAETTRVSKCFVCATASETLLAVQQHLHKPERSVLLWELGFASRGDLLGVQNNSTQE